MSETDPIENELERREDLDDSDDLGAAASNDREDGIAAEAEEPVVASTVIDAPSALSIDVEDSIAVVTIDLPGELINKFTPSIRDEFESLIERLETDTGIRGAVLISGKPDTFIAGADLEELVELSTSQEAEELSRTGQMLLESLAKLRIPVVAAIHGACLGGGLESVLACRYRIATDDPKTILALPEVQLGLIPGAGGTQRLPRLVGLRAALDMILTGKNIRARKALQMGLIDELVHPSILRRVAVQRARDLADGSVEPDGRKHNAARLFLDDNPIGRSVVLRKAREETLKKTHGNYPAPIAALEAVAAGYQGGAGHGYREEARLFGEMTVSTVAKQLIYLFFATNSLKKDTGVEEPVPDILRINKLGILGAGFMGAGIASIAVQQRTLVRMKDADHARVGKGFAAVREVVRERLTRKQITRVQYEDMMSLLGGTINYSGFGNVDLVIEAVFEDLAVKHQVLHEVEQVLGPDAIFATNTSTIPIEQIAEGSRRPERVIGMHFFSPVHKMPLLEVIVTPRTDRRVTASVVAFGKRLGKTVIVVRDGPGFYANRILTPYINQAGRLLDEGVSIEEIDEALVSFGFPVGPITLLDEVGLDVASKAGRTMHEELGERFAPPDSFTKVIEAGRLGRKAKKGFYLYDEEGKKGGVDPSVYELFRPTSSTAVVNAAELAAADEAFGATPARPVEVSNRGVEVTRSTVSATEIQERTVYAMLNEAARCLEEGIVRSERDGDVGAVYGIGFPPFRGGPFRYMETLGSWWLVQKLQDLNERFPGRYEPADWLKSGMSGA
jgi:3-hydroxyacyl-CoA dehydrogenase / enoyl-CoA hydratase / 3-hydroxybutyryl-CoA epimerase